MDIQCKKCGIVKDESAFYTSNHTACKECVKVSVRKNRDENLDRYRLYDRKRSNQPERVIARAEYAQKERGRLRMKLAKRKYIAINADVRAAHSALSNAVRDMKIKKQPCLVCGETKTQGHHFDYSRPLDVIWLCVHHHSSFHKIEREVIRLKEQAA